MARILVLEDDKTRIGCFKHKLFNHNVDYVETSKEAILLLEDNNTYDAIFLDHDLGGKTMVKSGDNTGYEVAVWLNQHPDKQPNQIIIHSYNPVGRKNMMQVLPNAIEAPGIWMA